MKKDLLAGVLGVLVLLVPPAPAQPAGAFLKEEVFVGAKGVFLYFKSMGRGAPLIILHGGPGAPHDDLLPGLVRAALGVIFPSVS